MSRRAHVSAAVRRRQPLLCKPAVRWSFRLGKCVNAPGSATEMAHIGKACALLRASFEHSMRIWTQTTFVLSAPTRASNGSGLTVRRDSGEANWSADALRGRCRKCLTRLDAEFGRLVHRHGLGARQVWFTVSRDAEFGLRDLGTAWWESLALGPSPSLGGTACRCAAQVVTMPPAPGRALRARRRSTFHKAMH